MSKSKVKRISSQLQLRLTPFEFKYLVQWACTKPRKPAHIAFTAGAARDAARVIEAIQRFEAQDKEGV